MQILGYARTWPTLCFINRECRKRVFAHTNGFGDFVLFDKLGLPWQVHNCYLKRFCVDINQSQRNISIRSEAIEDYKHTEDVTEIPFQPAPTRDIRRIDPVTRLHDSEFLVFGYVQAYIENRAERIIRETGTLGRQHLVRTLGQHRSQLTIVTSNFESFTTFADLRNVTVQKKDMVAARLRAVRVVGVSRQAAVFLCDEVLLVRGSSSVSLD
jgi:hypothetical protein